MVLCWPQSLLATPRGTAYLPAIAGCRVVKIEERKFQVGHQYGLLCYPGAQLELKCDLVDACSVTPRVLTVHVEHTETTTADAIILTRLHK